MNKRFGISIKLKLCVPFNPVILLLETHSSHRSQKEAYQNAHGSFGFNRKKKQKKIKYLFGGL